MPSMMMSSFSKFAGINPFQWIIDLINKLSNKHEPLEDLGTGFWFEIKIKISNVDDSAYLLTLKRSFFFKYIFRFQP